MTRNEAKLIAGALAAILRDMPAPFRYEGQYGVTVGYRRGDFVSHGGNLWHCQLECVGVVPAVDSVHWQLAVKRGKDGGNG